MVRSKDGTIIAIAYGNGFLLFDSSNFQSLNLIKQVNLFNNQVDNLDITNDNKWIICTQINTGQYGFVNISDKSNISLKILYRTISVQGVVTFQNGDYAYLYSGSKGLIILDTLKLPQIAIVGTLQTSGWTNYINILQNENFLIISQTNSEMVLLIDIQDKANPQILSKVQLNSDVGYSSCLSQDQSSLFILSQKGLRALPIQSKILFNQIQYIYDSISQSYQQINSKQNFKVGFSYSIFLTPLYPIQGQQITDIFYYQNFQYEPLPDWITFSYTENTIYIKATKEGLGQSEKIPLSNQNIILLQVQSPLSQDSFIYSKDTDGIALNQDQSSLIFQQMREKFYITNQNLTNPQFFQQFDQISLSLQGFSNDQLLLLTQLTLRRLLQSIQIVPIQFAIESSLKLDFTNPQQLIDTSQTNLTCQFQVIDDSYGVFINKSYDGVLSFLSLDSRQLVLQGVPLRINQILSEKSLLFLNFTEINQIKFNLTISDYVNFDVFQNISLYNSNFNSFTLYKPVQLKLKLQDQLEKTHPNGVLYINSQVGFQFDNLTFESADLSSISYIILIKSNNQEQLQNLNFQNQILLENIKNQSALGYQLIPLDFWMDVDVIQLRFTGYSSQQLYFNNYQFKIIAFDGYSFAEDEFQIHLTGIPASFIVLIILYALGPLIILAIIFKLRKSLQNLYILKKWGRKYQEQVNANSYYLKKIVFVGDNLKQAQKLMDAMIEFILSNDSKFKNYCKQNILDTKLKVNTKKKYNTQLQNELEIKFSNNDAANKRKQISKSYYNNIVPKNFASQELKDQKELANIFKQTSSNVQQLKNQQEQGINKFLEYKSSKTIKRNKSLKKLILLFIDQETKDLSIQKIAYFLKYFDIKYHFEGKTYEPEYYNYQIILAIKHYFTLRNQQNFIKTKEKTIKPYPEIFFDIDMIQSDLKIIFEDIQEIFQNKKKCSIHLRSSEIDIIECFKHDLSVQFYNLRYYFQKTSYQLLLSKGINLMPNWIKLEIKSQNCLVIHGIPTFYELGQLQIRIYDKRKIIVCQFSLQILLRGQKNVQSAKNVGSQNLQNGLTFINKFSSVILSNQNINNQQQNPQQYQQEQQQQEKLSPLNLKGEQDQNIEQQNISFKSKIKRQSSIARSSFISIKLNQINEIDDKLTERNAFKNRQDTQELDLADECAIHLNFSQHKKFKRKETIQD
ncbi:transmembrane protein, putative (macronuclear) [Tetrahymena thermophila SB210]|uniref:Transmembrane protein, putative n=1 Tax=Tetrahymena thermophila (strain SB210) TaxID=312017 RepID=Q22E38_TETTS|nr:transmembrane protein, putative [Tetrahymena thermophila SB210]EAR83576.2 transmembrane protein, putative [Tetrahymena thermophila SB210]|eukprot:XP_001031239.2 transmembrane protein, putative [Tetrahymena thermophila SB210]